MIRTLCSGWVAGHRITVDLNEMDITHDGGAEYAEVFAIAPGFGGTRSCSLVCGAIEGLWWEGATGELVAIPPAVRSFLRAIDKIVDSTDFNTSNWGKE